MSTLAVVALVIGYVLIGAACSAILFYLDPQSNDTEAFGWTLGFLIFWPVFAPLIGAFFLSLKARDLGKKRKERAVAEARRRAKEEQEIDRIIAEQKL